MGTWGRSIAVVGGMVLVLTTLAGCSFPGNSKSAPNPTASVAQSVSKAPTASTLPTQAPMSPAQAKAAYRDVAKASCLAAQNTGVVEENNAVLKVMVSKSQAYKDYSAAYLEKPKTYGVIWEIDAFAACTDWYTFSMAQEAGTQPAIDVTFDNTDGSFTSSQNLGDAGVSTWKYGVAGGRIATAIDLTDVKATRYQVSYGVPDAISLSVLKTAVDAYLKTIN